MLLVAGAGLLVAAFLLWWERPARGPARHEPQSSERSASREASRAGGDAFGATEALSLIPRSEGAAAGDELLQLVDPRSTGWDSEVANERSGAQLHLIEELLADRERLVEAEMLELASPHFDSPSFEPASEGTRFESPSFEVARLPMPAVAKKRHRGPRGLAEALEELVSPFAREVPIQAHFKQYRIELAQGLLRSRAFFEASGAHSEGRPLQQSATFELTWDYAGESPRLRSLETREIEFVLGRSDGRTSFVDGTRAVLGDEPSFAQLLRSMPEICNRTDAGLGLDLYGHHGLSVADFDGDGLDDLYVCQPAGFPNLLYIRQADGRARERAREFGLDFLDATRAALAIDLDNDGDQDLVLGISGARLFENTGARFEAREVIEAIADYSISAADPDGDGDLDLYVCCYGRPGKPPTPYHDANDGEHNVFIRNEGAWRFVDATEEVGLGHNNTRHSFASSWADYDEDGDVDLYVANDYGRNNLYRNVGGHFEDVAAEAGVEDISAGMSVSWGDYDADGKLDLYVSNMFSSAGNRIAYQRQFLGGSTGAAVENSRRHARGNSLFHNKGDGHFEDVSVESATTLGRWAWGSSFVDVDMDGLQDLVVANGYLTNFDSTDL